MQQVVLDTNVLVSAIISPYGIPAKILSIVIRRDIQPCYDSRILGEYSEVLSRPRFNFRPDQVAGILQSISHRGLSVIANPSNIDMPDESDRIFYEVATACGALLITGNLKHYPQEPFIITPSIYFQQFHDTK
ncbi:MAG: putative toxin-antitoxin system toxin component, PIN family [Synergistaceae bacterium]|jgi:putative PIN family toxin of toxin-antitoxin system|nr:putative toxin-antitoxin system toxin component, PIN family [Synergistaceae bacterium]